MNQIQKHKNMGSSSKQVGKQCKLVHNRNEIQNTITKHITHRPQQHTPNNKNCDQQIKTIECCHKCIQHMTNKMKEAWQHATQQYLKYAKQPINERHRTTQTFKQINRNSKQQTKE